MATPPFINRIMSGSLVLQIAVGIVAGIVLSLISPEAGSASMLLGNLFVQALKAVARERAPARPLSEPGRTGCRGA